MVLVLAYFDFDQVADEGDYHLLLKVVELFEVVLRLGQESREGIV